MKRNTALPLVALALFTASFASANCETLSERVLLLKARVLSLNQIDRDSVKWRGKQVFIRGEFDALDLEYEKCTSSERLNWLNQKGTIESLWHEILTPPEELSPSQTQDLTDSVQVPLEEVTQVNLEVPEQIEETKLAFAAPGAFLKLTPKQEVNFSWKVEELYKLLVSLKDSEIELQTLEANRLSRLWVGTAYPKATIAVLRKKYKKLAKDLKALIQNTRVLSQQSDDFLKKFDQRVGHPEGRIILGNPDWRHFYSEEDKLIIVEMISAFIDHLVESKSYENFMVSFFVVSNSTLLDYEYKSVLNKPSQLGMKLPDMLKELAKGLSDPYMRDALKQRRTLLAGDSNTQGYFKEVNQLCAIHSQQGDKFRYEKAKNRRLFNEVKDLVEKLIRSEILSKSGQILPLFNDSESNPEIIALLKLLDHKSAHGSLGGLVTEGAHLKLISLRHLQDIVTLSGYKKIQNYLAKLKERKVLRYWKGIWNYPMDQVLLRDKTVHKLIKTIHKGSNREIISTIVSPLFADTLIRLGNQ